MPLDCFRTLDAFPGRVTAEARRAEDEGWAGVGVPDTQNRQGDVYVAMAVAATATTRLRLATGVTNPITRHAAVTASALASLAIVSDGRVELGIGRGDTALGYLGAAPAPVGTLVDYLRDVRSYLANESVPLERSSAGPLGLGARPRTHDGPAESRLVWLDRYPERPTVPIFVAASGPRVLRAAAEQADLVMISVGADPNRVRWALDLVRSVRPQARVGLYLNVVVDEDVERGAALASGNIALLARFSAMHGQVPAAMSDADRDRLQLLVRDYELTRHGATANPAASAIGPMAARFAVLGSPARCLDRLAELHALGLERIYVIGASPDTGDARVRSDRRFVDEVLPHVG